MSKKKPQETDERYEDNYRFSPEFIKKATRWIIIALCVGILGGFLLGIVGIAIYYPSDVPEWFKNLCYVIMGAGVVLPLTTAGWLGGQALHRFGGIAGLFLTLGIIGMSSESILGMSLWFWLGAGALVIGIIWIFYLGIQAKVPIWLQLPILDSPRLYITRGKKNKSSKAKSKK